jgi:hypothetical protein
MSDADAKLQALFALDDPPAQDPLFVLETARRIQQRRFWWELAAGLPWMIAASAILWVAAPWVQAMSRPAAVLLAALTPAAVLGAAAVFIASPRTPLS